MNMKKIGLLILGVTLAAALTACSSNTPTATPTPMVTTMPTMFPGATGTNPMASPTATGEIPTLSMTGSESTALSKKANDAAVRISEIDSCVTAIIGDTCVAGVTFDTQYKGVLSERIVDMVTSRIQSVAPGVERVAVTNDPEIAAQIGTVAEKISKASALGELTGEFDAVLAKIP